jgi:hypothetical protein
LKELEFTLGNTNNNNGGSLKFVSSGNAPTAKSIFDQGFSIDFN